MDSGMISFLDDVLGNLGHGGDVFEIWRKSLFITRKK